MDKSDRHLTFAVLAVEKAATQMKTTAGDVYSRLVKLGLVGPILFDGYDMLHTQSADFVADFVADAIHNHEHGRAHR